MTAIGGKMDSLFITIAVFVLTFLVGILGLRVQTWLDEHNSVEKSRDMIGSVLGLLTLLLALVLGTLIGNTYYFSTGQQAQLQSMMSSIVMMDKSLGDFGPEAKPLRDGMKAALQHIYEDVWIKGNVEPEKISVAGAMDAMQPFEKALAGLGALDGKSSDQKGALASAQGKFAAFMSTRIMMSLQLAVPFSKALLVVVIIWALLLFFGFGLLSRNSATTVVALAFGSICVAFAIFIIVELGEPYSGLFRISPAALVQTIQAIDR
jgi:hypothetical protein